MKLHHMKPTGTLLHLAIFVSVVLAPLGAVRLQAAAQSNPGPAWLVRSLFMNEYGLQHPKGLVFSPDANTFFVLNESMDATLITMGADHAGTLSLPDVPSDPLNAAFDQKSNSLFVYDRGKSEIAKIRADEKGLPAVSAFSERYNARAFGIKDAQGITFDPQNGRLFILDAADSQIVSVLPHDTLGFDANEAARSNRVQKISLKNLDLGILKGLAYNPSNGRLYVSEPVQKKLYELTQDGKLVATFDLTSLGIANASAMTFAFSADNTDDPGIYDLFVLDEGQVTSGSQSTGQILEVSLFQPVAAAAVTFTSTLVRTTDMAAISPPSPDPSGITYLPNSNSLMVVDGEVEETVNGITHFQGANVWELTLAGSKIRTANISKKAPTFVPMTDEPTGVTWNPINGHYFITEDGGKRVYDLNPGGDGLVGTSDDSWTYFTTSGVGNGDPEGIAFDTCNNRLFVADGVGREVYQYTLTGSLVSHFDVATYGVEDPESVEFNPDSCTLFVMSSNRPTPVIVETTLNGALIQTINISAANAKQAAGLAYAPASNGSGQKRFYIVDRAIDNNNDPRIIDGKMYEMTTLGAGTPPSPTPTATPTRTNTPTPGPSPTPTLTFTPSPTSVVTDLIFADSFESGNLSAWTSNSNDLGDLSVSTAAALVGSRGLQAVIDDINSIHVTDDTPNAEPRYRVRFYFDPNSISMLSGDTHFIFRGYSGASTIVLRVQFRFSNGNYQLRVGLVNDGSTFANSSWLTISDAPHAIELDWRASTGVGANNGGLTLWIDGVQQANLTGVDNDTRRIDRARLGAVSGVDTGTNGTYYFDAFESRRQNYIGP